jgi:hypothetical protein
VGVCTYCGRLLQHFAFILEWLVTQMIPATSWCGIIFPRNGHPKFTLCTLNRISVLFKFTSSFLVRVPPLQDLANIFEPVQDEPRTHISLQIIYVIIRQGNNRILDTFSTWRNGGKMNVPV